MLQNMTDGSPLKLLIPFTVPLLIGNVFQQLYNIADIIIVGRFIGVEALAAVGAVSPLFMLAMVLTIGLSGGFSVITGQRYGAGDMDGVRRSVATSIVLSLGFVLLIMIFMHLIADQALIWMNIPAALVQDSRAYLMIIVDGVIAMLGYNMLSSILRSLGDSKTPLYFLIISSVINIALALLFIIQFGWGVPGSAFALVIAQAISALLCVGYIYVHFPQLHLHRGDFNLDWPEMWEHLRMGLPMAVQFSVLGLGIIILQAVCNSFGNDQIAGFTTAARVEQLAMQPMISVGIAMAVFTAQNFGAHRFDRIRLAVRKVSLLMLGFSLFAAVTMYLFGEQFISLFLDHPSEPVLEAAQMYIMYTVPSYFFLSQIFIYRNACQGMGVSMIPMIAGTTELIMRGSSAVILGEKLGFMGICLAEPISWISCSIVVFASYHYFINVLEKKDKFAV